MGTLGIGLARLAPGEVDLSLPATQGLTQQHGYLHAGVVTTLLDSACGFAALSLMAPGADIVSVEFKVNLAAPAVADAFLARGRVVRSGRTLTVCTAEAYAVAGDGETLVALMQATMMAIGPRGGGR
jgi:uncharacterized protein (TIGR00369 family)